MSEGKMLSRKEIAKRIAAVEKVASEVKWENNDCLPRAVAFTHGYPSDAHKLGLHARAFVYQAIEASQILADRNGEIAEVDKFVVDDREETKKKIDQNLGKSDKAWLAFGNEKDSHILGILKLDNNEFLVANLSSEDPYLTMNGDQIADRLMEYTKYTDLGACIIGFRNK